MLLQKQDDRLVLRCHSKILASTADSKHTFSPVIKLSTVLVRQVATDNKALFVISMSDNGAQIYELVAQTVSEKTVWQDLICRMAASVKEQSTKPIPLPQPPPCEGDNDEEEPAKLKVEHHDLSVAGLQSPDRVLGLESPLISSKPQSHSLNTPGKSAAEHLFVTATQFAKEQHANGALKEGDGGYPVTIPGPHLPVSEERWALDALRNLGLLKQLLVQQLGLTEKSTQEDWQSFSRYGPASEEVQADSGIRDLENVKACHAREGQMSFKTGTGDIATCDSPRTSTESCAAQDSVILASQDSQASNVLVMDHMILTPEMPPAEPEGGLDESGEHFFDAREAHSDDNPSEGDGAVKKEEKDVNLRISGNCLILDGYDAVQESSTDEEVASSFPLQPVTGIPAVDSSHQQQHSPQNVHPEGPVSPFTPEFLVQRHWRAMEDTCFEIQSPSCTDSQSQILEYIHKIEADLEHLKKVEESYALLCQRLAGSALPDKLSDKS